MADTPNFAKLIPGFDFLQGLTKNAGAAMPNIGEWVAPTLDPEELDKRIGELRTVQFWLEQNARMLGATIQALEVQRMTLSTLKTMNVQMEDLRDSLQIRMPTATPAAFAVPGVDDTEAAPAVSPARKAKPAAGETAGGAKEGAKGAVDPLQWWGALTKQFTELAAGALKESNSDAARKLSGQSARSAPAAATPASKAAPSTGRKRAPPSKRARKPHAG